MLKKGKIFVVQNLNILRIGTRKSPLALKQALLLKEELLVHHPSLKNKIQIVPMETRGDQILHKKLDTLGGKGLFTKELEQALLENSIDMAIHSVKDMATTLPPGLTLGCLLSRSDPRDVFISPSHTPWEKLTPGSIIGTASLRRQAQILALKPHIEIKLLRGNIGTRLEKLRKENMAGTFLALAGLERLGLAHLATQILPIDDFLPAVAQGALGIEIREDNEEIKNLLAPLHHQPTDWAITSERSFLARLDGSCRTPIAGYAFVNPEGLLVLKGLIAKSDGTRIYKGEKTGDPKDALLLGKELAEDLLNQGGHACLLPPS